MAGFNTVTLNFSIPAGGPYYMGATNDENLAFPISGISYPYKDAFGAVSITGNNLGYTGYYPYFFNWQIEEPYCISARGKATANISVSGTWNWTGGTSTDWFTGSNWDQGVAPGCNAAVVIPGGTTYEPTITGATGYCNTISINTTNGGVLTIATGSSGDLSVSQ